MHRLYPIGDSDNISAKWFMGTFWVPRKKIKVPSLRLKKHIPVLTSPIVQEYKYDTYLWTFEFLRQKASEPLNQMT